MTAAKPMMMNERYLIAIISSKMSDRKTLHESRRSVDIRVNK